nr:NAC domain-containing protein [Tanacetum cinerariifolium]
NVNLRGTSATSTSLRRRRRRVVLRRSNGCRSSTCASQVHVPVDTGPGPATGGAQTKHGTVREPEIPLRDSTFDNCKGHQICCTAHFPDGVVGLTVAFFVLARVPFDDDCPHHEMELLDEADLETSCEKIVDDEYPMIEENHVSGNLGGNNDSQGGVDPDWWDGESQFILDSQQLVEGLSLCDELLRSQSPQRDVENQHSVAKPCLADYAHLGPENLKKDIEACKDFVPDVANLEMDTPPDFRLSQLEFESQESFLAWGGVGGKRKGRAWDLHSSRSDPSPINAKACVVYKIPVEIPIPVGVRDEDLKKFPDGDRGGNAARE